MLCEIQSVSSGFELVSPCPFLTTITITARAPPIFGTYKPISRHHSLSSIASGWSSRLQHPVSPQSCCMSVLAGRSTFARPCEGVHRSMPLMSSYFLLQRCSACLVCLTWIVFMMDGRWPYSNCFVEYCLQD